MKVEIGMISGFRLVAENDADRALLLYWANSQPQMQRFTISDGEHGESFVHFAADEEMNALNVVLDSSSIAAVKISA